MEGLFMSMDNIVGPITAGAVVGRVIMVVFLAIIVEYLTNIFKQFIPKTLKTEFPIPLLISLILGIGLGLTVRIDILRSLGFEMSYPVVSYILTGLIASGGSAGVHEIIAKLRASRKDFEIE